MVRRQKLEFAKNQKFGGPKNENSFQHETEYVDFGHVDEEERRRNCKKKNKKKGLNTFLPTNYVGILNVKT